MVLLLLQFATLTLLWSHYIVNALSVPFIPPSPPLHTQLYFHSFIHSRHGLCRVVIVVMSVTPVVPDLVVIVGVLLALVLV